MHLSSRSRLRGFSRAAAASISISILTLLVSLAGSSEREGSRFERWEDDIAEFEERDRESPPPEDCLLFVGSSSIRLWDLEDAWPDEATVNNGFGGSTLADAIHYFDRLIAPYQPRAILLYAGDNDIAGGLSPEGTRDDFVTLLDRIRSEFPDVLVGFIAIKPSRKRWEIWPEMREANELIAEHCETDDGAVFVDIAAPMLADAEGAPGEKWFADDGLHMSDYGYEIWARTVKETMAKAQ